RESAASNTLLVLIKLGVVFFVIAVGAGYISQANWNKIPPEERRQPQEALIPDLSKEYAARTETLTGNKRDERIKELTTMALAQFRLARLPIIREAYDNQGLLDEAREKNLAGREKRLKENLPTSDRDKKAVAQILKKADEGAPAKAAEKWGILALLG